MFKPSEEFVEWILAPMLERLEHERNQIRRTSRHTGSPTHFYLAEPIRAISPMLLPAGHFIIKSGIAKSIPKRASQLNRDFNIFAEALLPDRSIAKDIEDRIQKSLDYGTRISENWIKNHDLYGTRVDFRKIPAYISEREDCLLHDVESYNLMVNELNRHFEGEPFPRR